MTRPRRRMPPKSANPRTEVFVGSYATAEQPGVFALSLDESRSELHQRTSLAGIRNPSFLAVHPSGGTLYGVSEVGHGSDGRHGLVYAIRIARDRGEIDLAVVDERSTRGDHPCHVGIDVDGRWLAVSNYGSGSVVVLPIAPDGSLGEMASSVQHSGSGPDVDRQRGPHAHSAIFSPDNRFLIAADLGIDRLVVYSFDAQNGSLAPHAEIAANPGAGPRHLGFHPDGHHLFVVNELSSTITVYRRESWSGMLEPIGTSSTIPHGVSGSTAADVRVSTSGRHVYVSNRGHNSLAVYAFDQGRSLELLNIRSCGGVWPRSFGLAPAGRHVVVANRRSDEIVLLALLAGGSDVGEPVARARISQPSCIAFAPALS